MEWPGAFGDGLRMFPHHTLESPFLPDAPFPDASHGIFGKTQSLWDEATVGKLKQHLRDDTTARDVSTPRRYSDHVQDLNRDLDLEVTRSLALVVSRRPPLNIAFALAEVVWIMAGRRDLAFLEHWNKEYRKFVGPGPELHGAYGNRLRHQFGIDQLERAYLALKHKSDTRQVVLQIWDSRIDMPGPDGAPVSPDIPCNVLAMPKLRDGKLEWLQVIRSNDMFLGVPYNFIQFTFVQEILAGWLGVECGSYNQISDSLHVYDRDWENVISSTAVQSVSLNTDYLAQPRRESDQLFRELELRVQRMIDPDTTPDELDGLASWHDAPQAYRNIWAVLSAEALRRRGLRSSAARIMSICTNPCYRQLWDRWWSSRPSEDKVSLRP